MPGISQKRFHSTIKGPAADALASLEPHSHAITRQWTNALREIGLRTEDVVPVHELGFDRLARALRQSTLSSFRRHIHALVRRSASRGTRFESAAAALNRLFEVCLPFLARSAAVAFTRLHSVISLLLAADYVGQPAPALADLSEPQHKLPGGSAYVTRVYERERRLLSHDLHDEVGHDLIIIKLYLEMISMSLEGRDRIDIKPRLDEAIGLVAHAIDSVRRLVLDLGPAVFDELGFLPAVKSYAGQFSSRTHINVTVQEGYIPAQVPLTHQIALYRLLQGALSNVLKHAHARNVRVSLGSVKDSMLIMVVEDDGVGFDTAQKPGRRSFGLTAMRERVAVLGGRILVESARAGFHGHKHGTRIEVDLPLTVAAEK
jgi:signal transduction histidine kinase